MRSAAIIGWVLVVFVVGMTSASADTRVALVIGNSTYQNVPYLPNPVNDAADISASLSRLGFIVKTLTNAKYDDMRRALLDFGRQARGADFAIVFFAGHGIQMGGENWLIPVDAQLATDLDVANEAIGLQSITRAVSNTAKLGLVMLDACRSNPFLPKMQSTNVSRAVERGFSRIEPSDNVLVAYAARDGTTAQDGSGRNSPFTQSLLKNLEAPGLEIRFLFANVRDDVMQSTRREQQPFVYGSLSRDMIYLKAPSGAGPSTSFGGASTPIIRAPAGQLEGEAKPTAPSSAGGGGNILGLTVAELDADTRARYSIKPSVRGVVVTAVEPGSAGAESKLREGDIIVEVMAGNGMDQVFNENDVRRRVEQAKGLGRKSVVLYTLSNDGKPNFLTLRVGG